MSDDYPFGADCDTDAMPRRELCDGREFEWYDDGHCNRCGCKYHCDRCGKGCGMGHLLMPCAPSSSPSRGDGATGPGGGAPTSKEPS